MQRLYFVQWLRVFLISLVVAHHAGQPYGPTGGWWPIHDTVSAKWLGPFFGVNAAFFMGFFFLIAGYFTGTSYDRKGASAFVRDRLIRLGIPLAIVAFAVFPPLVYLWTKPQTGFVTFYLSDYLGRWQIETGHLWFVAQLLAYSLLYLLWRTLAGGRAPSQPPATPDNRAILVYTLALALVGALVRSFYPQDVWVRLFWLVPAEAAHLPQYASLFVIGIIAGYGRWFVMLPSGIGKLWFAVAAVAILTAGFVQDHAQALPIDFGVLWGVFEAFICVGLILGLIVFFRRYLARPGRWLDRLDDNVYGVYLVHWFIVIALQAAILSLPLPATVKFLVVTVAGIVASFALTAAARRIPLVRRVV